MPARIMPLLDEHRLAALRTALAGFTVDGVHELLGPTGRAALERADLLGVDRALPADEPLSTLVRLFLLGAPVSASAAARALAPLPVEAAADVVMRDGDEVRAAVEVRPHAADDGGSWLVVSDFGSDVRPGPLTDDHVLGIGAASLTLAQAVPRRSGGRALDLGTGCGVQSLHLATLRDSVVATDISSRALRMAATTAALSGQSWELRQGSLLEPVADERFDTIVANPPFVVSPGLRRGAGGFDYRDSGLAGDGVSAALLHGLPGLLAADGTASLLINWLVPRDGDWAGRVSGWLAGTRCDAWIWQREVVEPAAYVGLWLRDAGEMPGTPRWRERYTAWLDWFATVDAAAVGMGLATLQRSERDVPVVVCEDVPQPVEQPVWPHIDSWFVRQRWLAAHDDAAVLAAAWRCADDITLSRHDMRGDGGWQTAVLQLRQTRGLRWDVEADDAVARLVGACSGAVPLSIAVELLAGLVGDDVAEVTPALLPVVRDLVARGFLELPA